MKGRGDFKMKLEGEGGGVGGARHRVGGRGKGRMGEG